MVLFAGHLLFVKNIQPSLSKNDAYVFGAQPFRFAVWQFTAGHQNIYLLNGQDHYRRDLTELGMVGQDDHLGGCIGKGPVSVYLQQLTMCKAMLQTDSFNAVYKLIGSKLIHAQLSKMTV